MKYQQFIEALSDDSQLSRPIIWEISRQVHFALLVEELETSNAFSDLSFDDVMEIIRRRQE